MNPINRIGQKVVCVGNERVWTDVVCATLKNYPRRGQIYTVTSFETFQTLACIHLREIPGLTCVCRQISGAPWLISAFKPVDERETDISIFKAQLDTHNLTVEAVQGHLDAAFERLIKQIKER